MSLKNVDKRNRWRNKTVAFRMSPEEAEILDDYVRASGLNKQDYLISRVLQKDVYIKGNTRVYKGLKQDLEKLYQKLDGLEKTSDVSDDYLNVLEFVSVILYGMEVETDE